VNRSLTDDVPAHIELDGFRAAETARVEQISAISRYVMNDEVEPKRVVPQPSSVHISPSGPLTVTLPHESVTVIRLEKR
jgi:alpha-N-arabinofuranosidase